MAINPYSRDGTNPALSRSFLIGSSAQISETLIFGQILDRIRVEQETNPEMRVSQAVRAILQKGGYKEMYTGFRWNLISGGLRGAFGWGIHNCCNRTISHLYTQENPAFPTFGFTTAVACTTSVTETTLFGCPLERFKIFQMTQTNARTVWEETQKGGIKFVYRGWSWMVVQRSWSWLVYLTAYQTMRRSLFNYNASKPLSTNQKIVLGASTGCLAAFFSAPLVLLKTQIQKASTSNDIKALTLASSLFKEHGWKGMFRGLNVKLARAAWSTTFTLLLLDRFNALPHNMKI